MDFLNRIIKAGSRMESLIDDLLSLSRTGRVSLQRVPTNLSQMAAEVVSALQQAEPQRQVSIMISENLRATVDPKLFRIVLENLLGNAWKYRSKVAEPRIEFCARRQDGQMVFSIKDNGAGFAMTKIDRLFAPFQRLHTTDQFEVTGIGLATVQRIIHRHLGSIWAEGIEGHGATFFFTIGDCVHQDPAVHTDQ